MKKLLTLVGAALAVGFAHAAAVSWNSGLFSEGFVGPDGNSLARSTAYTMVVSFYSDAAGTDLLTTSTVGTARPNGAYNTSTGDSYAFANGSTYYVSSIIKANDGAASWEAALASFTLGDTGDATLNFTSGAGFDVAGQKWSDAGWQSVPEPTSGLLMLLGVAGLALKRRRA